MVQQQCVCNVGIIMCYCNSPSTCQGCTKNNNTSHYLQFEMMQNYLIVVYCYQFEMLPFDLPLWVHYPIPDKVKLQQNYLTVLFLPAVAMRYLLLHSVQKHVVAAAAVCVWCWYKNVLIKYNLHLQGCTKQHHLTSSTV